jgi:hydrogenase nickel incorporation protein HypA/HybF
VVTRGTLAEGAALEIEEIPGRAWCMPCGESAALAARGDACPRCGSYQLQIIDGTQMRVKELEVS